MLLFSIICFWGSLGGFGWIFEINMEKVELINQVHNLNLQLIDLGGSTDIIINKLNNQILDLENKYLILDNKYNILEEKYIISEQSFNLANKTLCELEKKGIIIENILDDDYEDYISSDDDIVDNTFNNNN